ncbi:hypothetical protein NEFER03_0673 [Nematocida sp. LUAm3]|nr:hypothetical protein NEFER03_0673 [Nematocida sp. LUAm3]KAI5175132.1 hypothetical protein NEFER02_1093 [Nematocida sp. LUAm2]KAI5178196.1 hypothetical protein NEFER01_1374 [Nematocida sp. LUAm1]
MTNSIRKLLLLVSQVSAAGYYGYNGGDGCGAFPSLQDNIFYGNDSAYGGYDGYAGCGAPEYGSYQGGQAGCYDAPAIGSGAFPSGGFQEAAPYFAGPAEVAGNVGGSYCPPSMPQQYAEISQQYPSMASFDYSPAQAAAQSCGTFDYAPAQSSGSFAQAASSAPAPMQQAACPVTGLVASQLSSTGTFGEISAQTLGEQPMTVTLNGNVPVSVQPSSITVGDTTYPLAGVQQAASSHQAAGNMSVETLLTQQDVATLAAASALSSEAAAGTTAEQLKREQELNDKKDCKKDGKKKSKKSKKSSSSGAGNKRAQKKKNGVAGVSTIAAAMILPIVAFLL